MAGSMMSTVAGRTTGKLHAFLVSLAVGLACAAPLLYYGGPPDLLLSGNPSGTWLFITPGVVTAVAAVLLGRRGIGRIALSIVAGAAVMASTSLLLGSRVYILGLLPVGLTLGGAAVGHAAGMLTAATVRTISRQRSFTGEQTIVWVCTILGVVGSFALTAAGFAAALDHGTVDYWVGGLYAVSFLGLSVGLASAIAVLALGCARRA